MLIRRYLEHIKSQNWSAVFLDIIVVIVGIYLGMQVTNWNDERKAKQDEQEYIEALKSDLVQVRTAIKNAQDAHLSLVEDGLLLMRYLKGEVPFEENREAIVDGLLYQFQFPMPQIRIGELGLLMDRQGPIQVKDKEARLRLLDLIDDLNRTHAIYQHIEDYVDHIQLGYLDRFSPGMGRFLPGNDTQVLEARYDLEALKVDKVFLTSFQNVLYRHEIARAMLGRMDRVIANYLNGNDS